MEYSDAYDSAISTADVAIGGISIFCSANAGCESRREKRRGVADAKCILEVVCLWKWLIRFGYF